MYLISFLLTAAAPAQAAQDGADKVQQVIQHLIDGGVDIGGRILGALVIFLIGRFLISFLNKLVRRILERRKVDAGIRSFVESLVNILLMVLLIVAIVDKLGIETTSFAALLASAGVAVGMALSGNLQNFAGGLIILLFRPYKVGDWIECQGESGSVKEIQIFHTILTTADNKTVYIPNGSASSGVLVNYSNEETRRVDWVVGVEYGEDYARVEEAARRIVAADKRILDTPAPFIALDALDASSVNIRIRVWVKNADYWGVYYDVQRAIYDEFNKAGIGFPFPQLTVHQAKD
ncbi:mechanosensitive ion channel [Bacteroides sp. ET71]|uniref:mechanosensitive ion channel family protein n=1 Tax=Bacteroides sp. ET71 TaxID=2939421 RepID=UPI0020114377|nr:mechanosensitive ion channel domain-containing protein [Bacteroides sp. ET71]MCL1616799.1 mechanosensitive ion channel [Bacteroides sp. ET71]